MHETLQDVLAASGGAKYGVLRTGVSRSFKTLDGTTCTTTIKNAVIDDLHDSTVLPAMAMIDEVSFKAKLGENSLSQVVTGQVAAARNGHEDSIATIREKNLAKLRAREEANAEAQPA